MSWACTEKRGRWQNAEWSKEPVGTRGNGPYRTYSVSNSVPGLLPRGIGKMPRRKLTNGNPGNGVGVEKTPAEVPPGPERANGREHGSTDGSKSREHQRHERLVESLREMVETESRAKVAEVLGVSYRTLVRAVDSGRLTARMADALERHLLEVEGSANAPVRQKHVGGLEADVAKLRARVDTMQAVVGALQEDQARTLRRWERRLARVEARPAASGSGAASTPSVKGAAEAVLERPQLKPPRRPYPQLVTVEPEEGEELLYGEAMPAITEWRETGRALDSARRRLDKLDARQRMLELEVRLVEDHELTLPPAVYPWDRADRRDEVWRRKQSLQDLQVERSRALLWRWVRRVLTLGLWWK